MRDVVPLLRTPATAVWGVLVVATVLSWALGHDHSTTDAATVVGIVVLVIAMIKVRLVGSWFMELRGAPQGLRLAFDGWCVGVGAILLALFAWT